MRHQMQYEPDRICFMQDAIHGVLKLRGRMLRSYDEMPIGTKQVSVAHLKVNQNFIYFTVVPKLKIICFLAFKGLDKRSAKTSAWSNTL